MKKYCLEYYDNNDNIEKEKYFNCLDYLKKFIDNNDIYIVSVYDFINHDFIFICDLYEYEIIKKLCLISESFKKILKECD